MSRLRVLLVGGGWAAHRHAEAVTQIGDRVSALVEPDAERRAALGERLGTDAHASLADWRGHGAAVDAAVIASPSSEHLPQTLELVRAGVPVLVEKPHRLPGEDASELLEASHRSGVPVQIGMSTRYGAGMQALRRALGDGSLGDPAWVSDRIWFQVAVDQLAPWYFDRRSSGGGVLVTNGVHAVDRVAWLLGERLDLVRAEMRTLMPGRDVEDAATLQLTTASGVRVAISLLWAPVSVPESDLRVVASKGVATVRADGSWTMSIAGQPDECGAAEPELAPFTRQWKAFRDVLSGQGPVEPGLDAGERVLATIEAAYTSQVAA